MDALNSICSEVLKGVVLISIISSFWRILEVEFTLFSFVVSARIFLCKIFSVSDRIVEDAKLTLVVFWNVVLIILFKPGMVIQYI